MVYGCVPKNRLVRRDDGFHAVMILAGGTGRRLGGVSKPDVRIGGRRLIDLCIDNLPPCRHIVAIAPDSVEVPDGVWRVVEDPPLSGPAAGVAAGWKKAASLEGLHEGALVALVPTDAPLAGKALPALQKALLTGDAGCALAFAHGFAQRTIAVFRARALEAMTRDGCLNMSLRRALERIDVVEVPVEPALVMDVDTPEDRAQLEEQLGCSR